MATEIICYRPKDAVSHITARTPHDVELISGLPSMRDFLATISFPRSLQHNRWYWTLLGKVVENHEFYSSPEVLHLWIKKRLGLWDELKFHDGQVHLRISSTSFPKMDQGSFKDYCDRAIDVIVTDVLPGVRRRDLIAEIEKMVGINYRDLK